MAAPLQKNNHEWPETISSLSLSKGVIPVKKGVHSCRHAGEQGELRSKRELPGLGQHP